VVSGNVVPDAILVSRSPGETRYALLAGEDVVEVRHVRDIAVQPGAVYVGRAAARLPSGKAMFVDFGDVLPGVLPVKDLLTQGTAVAVEVVVPARADKGAELKASTVAIPHDAKVPGLLCAAADPAAAWADCYGDGIVRVVASPRAEATRLQALLGRAVEEHTAREDLFAACGVDAVIEAGLLPTVPLPCGGNLVIETTAAAVMIDVNSGPAEHGVANMEALTAAAAALRLRNIAGHILIDIIPTRRRTVLPRHMAEVLDSDPVSARVAGVTPLGMIEMTRQRIGLSLAEMLCDATGLLSAPSVGYRALRAALRHAAAAKAAAVQILAAPEVVAILQGPLRAALREAEDAVKGEIKLEARTDYTRTRVDVVG
jgi:ribonuclease G